MRACETSRPAGRRASAFWLRLGLPLALWYVSGAIGVLAGRLALARLVWRWERAGRLARRTAVYGTGPLAEQNELIDVFKFRSIYVDQGDSSAASLVT